MKHNFRLSIKFLRAGAGDAILIRFCGTDGKYYNLLVDGGTLMMYPQNLRKEVEELVARGEVLDLVIVTHHDDDHAKGIERLLKDVNGGKFQKDLVKMTWINALMDSEEATAMIGAKTAMSITQQIKDAVGNEIGFKILAGEEYNFGGAEIQIISPTLEIRTQWEAYFEMELEELRNKAKIARGVVYCDHIEELSSLQDAKQEKDSAISNGASIAFILRIGEFAGLFLGDAWADEIARHLASKGFTAEAPLEVALFKLSHHGGFRNISEELLDLVKAENYVVSSVGKTKCKPSKRTVAKIIKSRHFEGNFRFIFNYPEEHYSGIFTPDEAKTLKLVYSNFERGYVWQPKNEL